MNFLDRFSKNTNMLNFMKIRHVGGEFFRADGRTDRHAEANRRVRNFAKVPKKHEIR